MHCDMLKIQDGGAIVEKLNCQYFIHGLLSDWPVSLPSG